MLACELYDTTSTSLIVDEAGMNGCLANERIGAIYVLGWRSVRIISLRSAYDERLVIDLLGSHGVRIEDMRRFAVSRASEGLDRIIEWATSVPVKTAAVSSRPVTRSAPYWLWPAITFDISGSR